MKPSSWKIASARRIRDAAETILSGDDDFGFDTTEAVVKSILPAVCGMPPDKFGHLLGTLLSTYAESASRSRVRTASVWAIQSAFGSRAAPFTRDMLLFIVAAIRDRDGVSGRDLIESTRSALDDIEDGRLTRYMTG